MGCKHKKKYIIGEREKDKEEESKERWKREIETIFYFYFYIICLCSLYYFIGQYVKIRIEMLGVLLNKLVK